MEKSNQEKQVEMNFKVFQKQLPELMKTHKGKYALMRDSKIISFHERWEDAHLKGMESYKDDLFSIQKITDVPVNLGIYSCVMSSI